MTTIKLNCSWINFATIYTLNTARFSNFQVSVTLIYCALLFITSLNVNTKWMQVSFCLTRTKKLTPTLTLCAILFKSNTHPHLQTHAYSHAHCHSLSLTNPQTKRKTSKFGWKNLVFVSLAGFPTSFLPSWNSVNEYRFVHWTSWYSPTNQLLFLDYRWNSHLREVSVVGLSKTLLWTENKLKPKRSKVSPSAYVIYIKNIKKPHSIFLQEELSRGVIECWI